MASRRLLTSSTLSGTGEFFFMVMAFHYWRSKHGCTLPTFLVVKRRGAAHGAVVLRIEVLASPLLIIMSRALAFPLN